MSAPVRGRDQSALCGFSWSVENKNVKGVVIHTSVHACVRSPSSHTDQHVCSCSARRNNP